MKLSYDGFGINDAEDPYKARVLTFSTSVPEERREQIGAMIEAAPDLLKELENILPAVEAYAKEVAKSHGANHDYSVMWQSSLQKARDAIAKANSENKPVASLKM